MGRKINDWAWRQELPLAEKAVLLCLAQHAPDSNQEKAPHLKAGECIPGIERLSRECGCSESSVKRHREALVARGLIEVHRRSHGSRRTSDLTVIVGWRQEVNLNSWKASPRGQPEPAKSSICSDQEVNLTSRSTYRKQKEKPERGKPRPRARPPALLVLPERAEELLATFNDVFGTEYPASAADGQPTSHLQACDGFLNDNSQMTADELLLMLQRNANCPWWDDGFAAPGILFGSEKQRAKTLANVGWKQGERKIRRDIDRPRDPWEPGDDEKQPF